MKGGRLVNRLLLGTGLSFAFLGQFYFACRREYVWDGVFLWGVAILAFGLLLMRTHPLPLPSLCSGQAPGREGTYPLPLPKREGTHPLPLPGREGVWMLGMVGGACMALSAGWMARLWPAKADFSGLLWLWLAGVATFLLSFAVGHAPRDLRSAVRRWRLAGWELAGLAALLAAALAVRAVGLEHIPANLGGDEGTQGVAALELLGPPLGNPFSTGWFSVPTMSFLAYGLAMRVLGASVAGLRALSALLGTLTVLTTFLLARELWGRRVAWLAAVALAGSHYHIHFSRLGSNQIADGLLVTLALWLLMRGLRMRRGQEPSIAVAGAVIGLGWYVYFGARLTGIIVALYLGWRAVVEYRFLARNRRLLLILLVAALVVAGPLLSYYVGHPENLSSRSQQVSIFASGWLAREREITGRSTASLLVEQFWKAISAFHYTFDPTFWYHPSMPLLDTVSGVLLVVGLLWAMAHWRWPANGLLLSWFWLALLLGWVVTENPPSSQRMLIIAPALALLVGLGLDWLVGRISESASQRIGESAKLYFPLVALVVGAVVVANLYYYFAVYTPSRVYGNPTAEVATELGRSLAQQDDGWRERVVCFHGPPFMYWGFGTLQFLARGVEGIDVPPPGEGADGAEVSEGALECGGVNRGARFVFLPERLDELAGVRARLPGGVEIPVYSTADGRLLYVVYALDGG